MLHPEQYHTDPSSLKSLYIMLYLTLQRLCEHSLTCKLTFCPLKDYHFDRIHKTLLCLLLTVSYFRIFTNGAVRKCRWGGQWNAQTNPCSPDRLSDSLPSILHTVEVGWGEWALGWSWRFMQPHSAFISSWKTAVYYPERKIKRQRHRRLWNPGWSCVENCVLDQFSTPLFFLCVSHWIWYETCNWIDQRRGILGGRIYYSHMHDLIQHTPTQWLNMGCWFHRQVKSRK